MDENSEAVEWAVRRNLVAVSEALANRDTAGGSAGSSKPSSPATQPLSPKALDDLRALNAALETARASLAAAAAAATSGSSGPSSGGGGLCAAADAEAKRRQEEDEYVEGSPYPSLYCENIGGGPRHMVINR